MAPVRAQAPEAGRWTQGASRWLPQRRRGWLPCSNLPRPQPLPPEVAVAAAPSSSTSHLLLPQLLGLSRKPRSTQGKWLPSSLSAWRSASQRVMGSQDRAPLRGSWPRAQADLPTWPPTSAGPLRTSVMGTTQRARRRHQSQAATSRQCGTSMAACDSAPEPTTTDAPSDDSGLASQLPVVPGKGFGTRQGALLPFFFLFW